LLPKPEGEGDSYQGLCKNLRPRLDWSVEDGWKVPCTAVSFSFLVSAPVLVSEIYSTDG